MTKPTKPTCSLLLWLLLLLLAPATSLAQQSKIEPAAKKVIDDYLAAYAKVRDVTYVLGKTERMRDGDVVRETLLVKLRVEPYAVYLARLRPEKGMEALYRAGKNSGNMTGHTGSFPDITLNLDPHGSLAMDDQHHPIYHTGQGDVVKRIEMALALAARGRAKIRILPDETVAGKPAARVEIDAGKAGGRKVRPREDETLFQLAKRVDSWPYLIYQYNPEVDDLDDELDEDEPVFVPAYYGSRTEFCFDKQTKLVVRESYFVPAGLYERYETTKSKTNVGLTKKDFDPENDEYDF